MVHQKPTRRFFWAALVATSGMGLLFLHEYHAHPARTADIAIGLGLTIVGLLGASAANVYQAGKEARAAVPRDSHAVFDPPPGRADPISLLEEQAKSRVPELVPVRHGRMLVSPFTFYRGAAKIMAADLKDTPTAGLNVQLCGDAHLSNFGTFAQPRARGAADGRARARRPRGCVHAVEFSSSDDHSKGRPRLGGRLHRRDPTGQQDAVLGPGHRRAGAARRRDHPCVPPAHPKS